MRLWLGGEIFGDVYDASFLVSKEVVNAVNARFKLAKSYGSGLTSWSLIPIIVPERLWSQFPEVARYDKRAKDCEFRLCVDYSKFKKSPKAEQLRLYCNMLRRSLDYLDLWAIEKLDVRRMRDDFELAVKHLDPGGAIAYKSKANLSISAECKPITKRRYRDIRVLKLFKKINRVWHYHEAWVDGTEIGEHWGKVGEKGKSARHRRDKRLSIEANLKKVLEAAFSRGFEELRAELWQKVTIVYSISGLGSSKELEKRHKLESKLSDLTGKYGLGNFVGGSTGMDTMEVTCHVVSFRIAKRIIQAELSGSVFADYVKISKDG